MLEVQDLVVRYGATLAVDSASFRVDAGEIVTFVGANGAGKTTTMRVLSGLVRPVRGSIRFLGEDITRMPTHKIAQRGLLQSPEGRMVFPQMTVEENLDMGAYPLRLPGSRLAAERGRVFELFPRLGERRQQAALTLSGGEQQMLAIGRALMGQPKLLLLDEPSLGVAPLLTAQIFARIGELGTKGLTVLLAEQNARAALALSSRGYVLELGRITRQGLSRDLLSDEELRKAYLGG